MVFALPYGNYYLLKSDRHYVNLYSENWYIWKDRRVLVQQHIQLIHKKLNNLNKVSKTLIRIGFCCLILLASASAILAIVNMLEPVNYSRLPLLIQSLFTYGFYVWAELTVGALIFDYVFQWLIHGTKMYSSNTASKLFLCQYMIVCHYYSPKWLFCFYNKPVS